MSLYTENKTWVVEDVDLFADSLVGLKRPDGAIFLAVEGQSTDDGKVFINTLSNQEDFVFIGAVVKEQDLNELLAKSKQVLSSRSFKSLASDEESEHGLAFWKKSSDHNHIDDDTIAIQQVAEKKPSKNKKDVASLSDFDDGLIDFDDDLDGLADDGIDLEALVNSIPSTIKLEMASNASYFVVMFGSDKSREFIDQAEIFFAETSVAYDKIIRGEGAMDDSSFDEIKMQEQVLTQKNSNKVKF